MEPEIRYNGRIVVNMQDDRPELSKESALEMVRINYEALVKLPVRFRDDKEVVLAALSNRQWGSTGNILEFVSERLRDDEEVVFKAFPGDGLQHIKALGFASERLKNDRGVVLEAVRCDGTAIQYAPKNLQNDREIALTAVKSIGWALEFLNKDFQDDPQIVLAAVNTYGDALRYASPRLRSNREVVEAAVNCHSGAIMFANPKFDDDKEIVLMALDHINHQQFETFYCDSDEYWTCTSQRIRYDIFGSSYDEEHSRYSLAERLQLFLYLGISRKRSIEEQEEAWQKKYGVKSRERVERWNREVEQWEQNRKTDKYENYKILRLEIEKMPKYKKWKQEVFEKHGKSCGICGSEKNLEVHHRKSFYSIIKQCSVDSIYKAFECNMLWDVENGSVLCSECHVRMESSQKHEMV